jgi:hypothetical protein
MLSITAREPVDRKDQPYIARLGELLCIGSFESVFLVYSKLVREKDTAAPGKGSSASGLWLEAMEYAVAS